MKFLQHRDFGLGNTINCTPAMIAYYNHTGKRVKAMFHSEYIEKVFQKADFLQIVDSMDGTDICSNMINQKIPDWKHVLQIASDKFDLPKTENPPHTYVDGCNDDQIEANLVVLCNNCANEAKRHTKCIDFAVYKEITQYFKKKGFAVVMLGSMADEQYNEPIWSKSDILFKSIDITKQLELIKMAKYVVTNDTGLYHVAGAMKKKGIVFWKDTNPIKNLSPNKNFRHSYGNYLKDFEKWVN
jgi:ADP-heptose:LPS heptosyltransferase